MSLLVKGGSLMDTPSLLSGFFDEDRWTMPSLPSLSSFGNGWRSHVPAANIVEKDDEYRIELAAPGMEKNDFHVEIENGSLRISSEKEEEKKEEKEGYTRKEFSYNSFSRSFMLPDSVNEDKIDASYRDGVLYLTLPKKEEMIKIPKKEIKIS